MPSISIDELAEALKELTYEHGIFFRRITELTELLREDSSKATEEFIKFMENAVFPHLAREETHVFPVISKLKPNKKPLIEELIEEHRRLEKYYKPLQDSRGGNVENIVKEILQSIKDHGEKEEPLYQLLLKEATKK